MFIGTPTEMKKLRRSDTNLMANTYSQIYVQIVFAVQGRHNLIRPCRGRAAL